MTATLTPAEVRLMVRGDTPADADTPIYYEVVAHMDEQRRRDAKGRFTKTRKAKRK